MPKRVKYDPVQIVQWLNSGLTWAEIDKNLGKTEGNTKRWLDTNKISICKHPSIYYWVTLKRE